MKKFYFGVLILIVFAFGLGIGAYLTPLDFFPPSEITESNPSKPLRIAPIESELNGQTQNLFKNNPLCIDIENLLDKYACWVEQGVEGIRIKLEEEGNRLTKDELTMYKSIECMNLVVNIVGYGRLIFVTEAVEKYEPPSMNEQEETLRLGYGRCGNHQYLFIEILKRAGVEARPVDFYFFSNNIKMNASHATAEVRVGDKWVFFDITWNSYWVKNINDISSALTLDEIQKGYGVRVAGNNSWYVSTTGHKAPLSHKDPFQYLHANGVQIIRNKGGIIAVPIIDGRASFEGLPNYVGKTLSNSPMTLRLRGRFNPSEASLDMVVGGICKDSALRIGNNVYPLVSGRTQVRIETGVSINIEGRDDVCYAVISNLQTVGK